mmetsp:Transcript_29724/g.98506  ORF Transcript_29724/g.98506 Transcript_29724/m.98506 type:complete len:330 (+) Transcript_29724:1501-2490(+)
MIFLPSYQPSALRVTKAMPRDFWVFLSYKMLTSQTVAKSAKCLSNWYSPNLPIFLTKKRMQCGGKALSSFASSFFFFSFLGLLLLLRSRVSSQHLRLTCAYNARVFSISGNCSVILAQGARNFWPFLNSVCPTSRAANRDSPQTSCALHFLSPAWKDARTGSPPQTVRRAGMLNHCASKGCGAIPCQHTVCGARIVARPLSGGGQKPSPLTPSTAKSSRAVSENSALDSSAFIGSGTSLFSAAAMTCKAAPGSVSARGNLSAAAATRWKTKLGAHCWPGCCLQAAGLENQVLLSPRSSNLPDEEALLPVAPLPWAPSPLPSAAASPPLP